MIRTIVVEVRQYLKIRKLIRLLDRVTMSDTKSGKIIIGNIRNNLFYVALDYTLASLFSKLGFYVYILVDDLQLPHHDGLRVSESSLGSSQTRSVSRKRMPSIGKIMLVYRHLFIALMKRSMRLILAFCDSAKLMKSGENKIVFLQYSEILKIKPVDDDLLESHYLQMNSGSISKNVDASHKRYFGGRDFDPGNKRHQEYAKLSIKNEIISELVAEYIIKEIQPALYITLDGIYTTFGTIVDRLKAYNIPVLIYQPNGFRDRSIYIGEKYFAINNVSAHWYTYIESGYTTEVRKETEVFMRNRLKLEKYIRNPVYEEWIRIIGEKKKGYTKAVAIFPNLTWDGALKERDTIFDGLGAWLKETVEWVIDKEILLVIREHPQPEHRYNNIESSLAILREILPDIDSYENVILIKGTESVNSYQLIKAVIDCSVVYNGTLGIEIPYMAEPVIIAANSPYSQKGIGYEPKSKEEYFDYIMKVNRDSNDFINNKEEIQENALRAAAYQFVYNTYYCPIMPTMEAFHSHNRYWQKWDLNLDSLDPGKNPIWRRTIDRFIEPLAQSKEK